LGVRAHHDAEEQDDEGGDGVRGEGVGFRLAEGGLVRGVVVLGGGGGVVEGVAAGFDGLVDGVVEEVADVDGFDEHATLRGG
jgi:hypothetical protein